MRVLLYVHRLTYADLSRNSRATPTTASNLASVGGVKYARLSASLGACHNHATTGAKRCATEGVARSVPRAFFLLNAACFSRSAAASSRATLSPPRDPPIHL